MKMFKGMVLSDNIEGVDENPLTITFKEGCEYDFPGDSIRYYSQYLPEKKALPNMTVKGMYEVSVNGTHRTFINDIGQLVRLKSGYDFVLYRRM